MPPVSEHLPTKRTNFPGVWGFYTRGISDFLYFAGENADFSPRRCKIPVNPVLRPGKILPCKISVCAVLPGDIKSGFTAARRKNAVEDGYAERVERSVRRMERDELNGMSAEAAGAYVARIALARRTKPLVALGVPYKAAAAAAKLLPRRVSNYIVGRMYAK